MALHPGVQWPGCPVQPPRHTQTSVAWKGSGPSEVNLRVPRSLAVAQRTECLPGSACPRPRWPPVCAHCSTAADRATGCRCANSSGCGPEVGPVATRAPALTAHLPPGAAGSMSRSRQPQQPPQGLGTCVGVVDLSALGINDLESHVFKKYLLTGKFLRHNKVAKAYLKAIHIIQHDPNFVKT